MRKIRHLRWYIAALLFAATVINYIDRQALSIVAPVLTKELNLSPIQYANILQAFLYAYTVMYVVSGVIVDRWGTRLGLGLFMTWWSVANMLHAFATTAMGLGVFRFLLGVGEPGNFMAAVRAVSEWYPARERAFVNGLVNAGAAVGAIISAPLVVWLYVAYGWRSAFVITGALGLVWLVGWLLIYYVPSRHPRITEEELALINAGRMDPRVIKAGEPVRWIDLLKLPQTWGLFFARFFSDPVWWFYLFWLPKYLVEQRHFTVVEMGMLVWLPYLSADLGSIFGGMMSGYLIKRGWVVLRARTASMWPFAMVMPISIGIALTASSAVAMTLICIITFSHMAWKTNLVTITNDLYPTRVVGSVAGICAFGNGLGSALFTALTGYVVQYFGYGAIFVLMGLMHPLAFVIFRAMVRGAVRVEIPETARI
jgi:MFS transporter, ACS family, hexuronate transporter